MGLYDQIIGGQSGNPTDISKMLMEKERADAAKAEAERRSRLNGIADRIHDILLQEDLPSDDVVQIFRIITNDIGTMAGKLTLSKIYGVPRPEVIGSGEGAEKEGQRGSDSTGEDTGSKEPGSGQAGGDTQPSR